MATASSYGQFSPPIPATPETPGVGAAGAVIALPLHAENRADLVLGMVALAAAIVFGAMTYAGQARSHDVPASGAPASISSSLT
jgi:hypothetical protein